MFLKIDSVLFMYSLSMLKDDCSFNIIGKVCMIPYTYFHLDGILNFLPSCHKVTESFSIWQQHIFNIKMFYSVNQYAGFCRGGTLVVHGLNP